MKYLIAALFFTALTGCTKQEPAQKSSEPKSFAGKAIAAAHSAASATEKADKDTASEALDDLGDVDAEGK